MSHARFTPTAGCFAGGQGRRIAFFSLLPTLVIVVSLSIVVLPRPAGADQIGDLKAQATQVSEKLIQDQLQIGAYQQQYSLATQKVASDTLAISKIGRQIGKDKVRITRTMNEVRQEAITSYMDDGSGLSGSDGLLFTGNAEKTSLTNEYTSIAAGNLDNALDELRTTERTLHAHQTALQQEEALDQSDQRRQATYLDQAVTTTNQMAAEQSEVTGQLATAITAQAAAQAAAAAAAVAAARRAAEEAAIKATKATVTATAATPGVGADPALNPYLQCVVQAESGGDYGDVSPNGMYMGAFQFSQPTWNTAAMAAGLPGLVGTPPNLASKGDQDAVAVALYALDGEQPWLGDRCS